VVTIEAIKQKDGKYLAYIDNGREYTGVEVIKWAKEVENLGAGEILITSVDREGTGLGFDVELVKSITQIVDIPVIAHGGANSEEDILKVIIIGQCDAVAISSVLHYETIKHINSQADSKEGNTEFLKHNTIFSKINPTTINKIKTYLINNNIPCRI